MIVEFYNLDRPHTKSELTVSEIAIKLEKRYKIIQRFNAYINNKFKEYLLSEVFRYTEINLQEIEEWVRAEWRNWIIGNGTGIVTQASIERGNQSFIDSGDYYMNMYMQVHFTKDELSKLSNVYSIIDKKNVG